MSIEGIGGFKEITDLTADTKKKIFAKPEQSAAIVHKVASQVLEILPQAVGSTAAAVKFLHTIIYLDQQYQLRYQQSPFTDIIDKMQKAFAHLKPTAEKIEKRILELLPTLDYDSPHLKAKLQELLSLLDQLERNNGILSFHKEQLVKALLSTVNPESYKENLYECEAWDCLCRRSPVFSKALGEAEPSFKMIAQEGQRMMLKQLRNSKGALSEIAANINHQRIEIKKTVMLRRLDAILSRVPHGAFKINENFKQNFVALYLGIKKFIVRIAPPVFMECWTDLLKVLDRENTGEFCRLLENYPDLHPDQFIPDFILLASHKAFHSVTLEQICMLENGAFNEQVSTINGNAVGPLNRFFITMYKKALLPLHAWLASHRTAIEKPYSQAEDKDRNLSTGTCLQNSIDRQALLMDNPHQNGVLIPMGSSRGGRVAQSTVGLTFNIARESGGSLSEAAASQINSSRRVGLVLDPSPAPIAENPEGIMELMSAAVEPQHDHLWILLITAPGQGHAMNIQIDHHAGIFRFIDDNLGVCRWGTYKEFKESFLSYLKAFYPEYTQFSLSTYRRSK